MIGLKESIRPSADLRNHYPEISKACRENREAIIFTVNGKGDTVSLSYEEYQNMKARIEILETVASEIFFDVKASKPPKSIDMSQMTKEEFDAMIMNRYKNAQAGKFREASEAFKEFEEKHF